MRTLKTEIALKNFWEDHESGLTIPEIARKNGAFPATYYQNLQEIAEKHGVSRKALLERNYPESRKSSLGFTKEKKKEIDASYIIDSCNEYKKKISKEIVTIVELLQ